MKPTKYDFSGWVTKNNVECSDGRTILQDAFAHQSGTYVPLVWAHDHDNPENTLGRIYLENRPEGVYGYGIFNNSKRAQAAAEAVMHKDVDSLSIWANHLTQDGKKNVSHGKIREVSLVLAGANPVAKIDFALAHGDENDEETQAVIYGPEGGLEMMHEDNEINKEEEVPVPNEKDFEKEPEVEEQIAHAEEKGDDGEDEGESLRHAFEEVLKKLPEEDQDVILAVVGVAADSSIAQQSDEENSEHLEHNENNNENNEEDNTAMKVNAFEKTKENKEILSHDEMKKVFEEARRRGNLKDAVEHADEYLKHSIEWDTSLYGTTNPLFPDPKTVGSPVTIDRDQAWVSTFMNATRKVPFARVKMLGFDITADEARAKGYVKGNQKVEEVIKVLKRYTDPQMVYKLQKMDRDDLLDITDFDVVAYLKAEMKVKLAEEIATAALVGDGRSDLSGDKIKEDCIRPIWTDADLFTIKKALEFTNNDTPTTKLKKFREAAIKARKDYKGSGNPVLFTTEDMLADLLLMDDGIGHPLYKDDAEVARAFRVSKIVTVPQMEGKTRNASGYDYALWGIIVNPADYTFGNNRGGEPTFFEDFNLDYNKQEYLIETKKSGALTIPYSAIAIEVKTAEAAGGEG